jgi:O-antigen/teichoic acid export membrane protein
MNWIAMAVGMVIPFFLTPIVVRTLGTTAYGVWILAVSTVAYLRLVDWGLRSAIIRFVAKADAQGKIDEIRSLIATSLWFRIVVASVIAVFSIALAIVFPVLFKIPPDLRRASQITVFMAALGIAVTLISGVFGAVLAAIHRFDVLSSIGVAQTMARAIGVILILRNGGGLVSLAYWEFTVILLSGLATSVVALRIFPACRVRIANPDIDTLKMTWSHSVIVFVILISSQIVFGTDNLVIGSFLSVGLVSFYSIGSSLVVYSNQVASALSTTFTPIASGLDASGKSEELRELLLRGTQATLGLVLPIGLSLALRGKTFIGLWMGKQYSNTSGTVLQILLIGLFFTVANSTGANIMFAIGKHKAVAKSGTVEAILNLGVSLVLVKTIGIYGVAWGTSITMAIVHCVFWPRHIRNTLGVPIKKYLWEGWTKLLLCSVPFAIASVIVDRRWHASSLPIFFLQILGTLPVYIICVFSVFRKESRLILRKLQISRMSKIETVSAQEPF